MTLVSTAMTRIASPASIRSTALRSRDMNGFSLLLRGIDHTTFIAFMLACPMPITP